MILGASRIGVVTPRLALLAFALWLAGAGHLICCASACGNDSDGARVATHAFEPDAMNAAHSCCHARLHQKHYIVGASSASDATSSGFGPASALTEPRTSHVAPYCCVSSGQTADRTARPRTASAPASAATRQRSSRDQVATAHVDSSSPVSRMSDRGGTYLRCCVFLI